MFLGTFKTVEIVKSSGFLQMSNLDKLTRRVHSEDVKRL